MPSLEGQVLVVTGGTQGVGEAIALESARLGAAGVVVCGRNAENGNRVAAEVAALGAESLFVQADLADVTPPGPSSRPVTNGSVELTDWSTPRR